MVLGLTAKNRITDTLAQDYVDDYLNRLSKALELLSRDDVYAVVEVLFEAWKNGRQVFICGNGGSAATASHMANDLCKFTIVPGKPRFKAFALSDNVPLMTAWGNDTSYENIYSEQLRNYIQPGDLLIVISASGNSPNVVRAVEVAREYNATTIAFTGDRGGKVAEMVNYPVLFPDDYIGRQEDGHMILDHLISATLLRLIERA